MKKKQIIKENFLENIPVKNPDIGWNTDDEGKVTLEIENKGAFNRLAQKLFKKPKVSYIHLDEMGSFIWPIIDGKKDIVELGRDVEAHFGEKANPLYERLAKYISILKSYGFISLKKK